MPEQKVSVEEMAARELAEDIPKLAKKIVDSSPQPYGVPDVTRDEELWAWNQVDDTIDVDGLRAQGVPEIDIAMQLFPLRKRLVEQGGADFKEQTRYAERMAARAELAMAAGKMGKRPARPK